MSKSRRPKVLATIAGSTLPFLIAPAGYAQSVQSDENSSASQGQAGEDIVVTASKRSEPISQVPGGVSAITGERLSEIAANQLSDYVAFVPGVSLQTTGRPGETNVTIRGVTPLSVGAAIGTYIDDVPYGSANNFTSGANLTPDLDPNDLERVEFLKGPQGTLYGASSLGGLIKYVTRDPNLHTFELRAEGGVYGVEHGGLGFNTRVATSFPLITDKLAIRLRVRTR